MSDTVLLPSLGWALVTPMTRQTASLSSKDIITFVLRRLNASFAAKLRFSHTCSRLLCGLSVLGAFFSSMAHLSSFPP